MSKTDSQLSNNKSDWSAIAAKAGLGAIPVAGSFLAELAGVLIPNQRIDRIAQFVVELNEQLEKLPEKLLESLRNSELFIDLVEEGFIRASRASSIERRRYILGIIKNGMTDDEANINNAKYLLGLLSEINDSEVIWLRYFYERTLNDKSNFRSLHENVLNPVTVTLGSSKEEREKGAVQASYKEHLERLGLIKHNVKMNKDLNMPEYDRFTNKPAVTYSQTTTLGAMLLEAIGLVELEVN